MATAPGWRAPRVLPHDDDIDAAATCSTPASAWPCSSARARAARRTRSSRVAERLGAGIATSLLGKPYVDESLPFDAGTMGHLGTTASAELMARVRHAPARRQQRSLDRVLSGAGTGPRRADRSRRPAHRPPLPDRGPLRRRRARRRCARCCRCSRTAATAPGGGRSRRRSRRGTRSPRSARRARPAAQPRSSSCASSRTTCPPTRRSAVDVGSVVYWYARHLRLPSRRACAPFHDARIDGMCAAVRHRREARRARAARWSRSPATARCR